MPQEQTIDYTNKRAILDTSKGAITLRFFPDVAPNHVKNFIDHAENGYYNGTIFHRVIKGFMIQGGDPTGTGRGGHPATGPGTKLKQEFNARPHKAGTLSMARTPDPDSAGSQFFICLEDQPGLDRQYTVFGEVESGMEVVKAIGDSKTDRGDRPIEQVKIRSVRITDAR